MLYAKLTHPTSGSAFDVEMCRNYLIQEELYEIDKIQVDRCHTSIFLKSVPGTFNSVNFDFYDDKGTAVDILADPKYNPYLKEGPVMVGPVSV